jgi:uncharacterized protein
MFYGEVMTQIKDYIEENVTFQSGNINLEGTLALPTNSQASSVILLLPGSGPTDRDENAKKGLHKFISNNMKFISAHLAQKGFASLRYDKRGVGKTKDLEQQVGFNDIVNDARSALQFLSTTKKQSFKNIFVLGHSEGGIVGMILTSENNNIKGFIGIASPITPFDEEVVRQIRHIFTMKGKSKEKVDQLTNAFKKTFDLMRKYRNWDQIDANKIKMNFSKVSFGFRILPANMVKNAIAKQFRPQWFIQSFDYNFEEIAGKLTCPVLLVFGEKDYQVPSEEGKKLEKILLQHNINVTLVILPDLNHMLRYNPGNMDPKTSLKSITTDFDERVLDNLTNWLQEQSGGKKP